MRPLKWLFLLVLSVPVIASTAPTKVRLRGYSLTDWYSFESRQATRHHQLYETFSFRLERPGVNTIGLVAHLRWQGDTADDFDRSSLLQAHNLYLRFNHADRWEVRLGRQFVVDGVGFGTFDALRLNCTRKSCCNLTLWGGLAAPLSRKFKVQKTDNAPAFGVAIRARVTDKFNVLGSYLYEEMRGLKFRHRAGVSSNINLLSNLTGTGLAHFNLSGPNVLHRLRVLLHYTRMANYRLAGEWALGTPQLFPGSPFEDVEIETFQLVRLSGAYKVGSDYWVGLRAQSLLTTDEPNTTLGLTFEGPWGLLGLRQRFGDVGEESCFFGSAQYGLTDFVQVYGSADFSRYKLEDLTDREDQAVGQLGLRLFPVKPLLIDASLQALKNTQFEHDVRGLLRVKWSFSN